MLPITCPGLVAPVMTLLTFYFINPKLPPAFMK